VSVAVAPRRARRRGAVLDRALVLQRHAGAGTPDDLSHSLSRESEAGADAREVLPGLVAPHHLSVSLLDCWASSGEGAASLTHPGCRGPLCDEGHRRGDPRLFAAVRRPSIVTSTGLGCFLAHLSDLWMRQPAPCSGRRITARKASSRFSPAVASASAFEDAGRAGAPLLHNHECLRRPMRPVAERAGRRTRPAFGRGGIAARGQTAGSPVAGLRIKRVEIGCAKLNMPSMLPASASNDPPPMRGSDQLSSMKRRTEVVSVSELSTEF
jgi:hypothetical protein